MADLNDIRDEFSPLLDDELSAEARDAVEAELAQDSSLLRELDALRKVDRVYRSLPRVSAPDDMAARVRDQLHAKPKVLPIRTHRVSRTVYTTLAAAAVFAVLIGGVVIQRELYGSSSPEGRFETAAQTSADDAGLAVGNREATSIAEAESEPSSEPEGFAEPEADARDLRSAPTLSPAPPVQQEALMRADAAGPSVNSPDAAPLDDGALGNAKERPAAMAAAEPPPPPPPPPAPAEALSEAVDETSVMAEASRAPLAAGVDADMADAVESVEERRNVAKKAESTLHRIADREFEERDDGWYERGYAGEPVLTVRRGSERLTALAPIVPKLSELLALEGDIVFKHAKQWYRVPADTP